MAGRKKLKKKSSGGSAIAALGQSSIFSLPSSTPVFPSGSFFPTLFPVYYLHSFLLIHLTMSAVQPVAVYALRVPPGAMVAAVPNAAASVSTKSCWYSLQSRH